MADVALTSALHHLHLGLSGHQFVSGLLLEPYLGLKLAWVGVHCLNNLVLCNPRSIGYKPLLDFYNYSNPKSPLVPMFILLVKPSSHFPFRPSADAKRTLYPPPSQLSGDGTMRTRTSSKLPSKALFL
ncbi:hypothetical protein ACFX13_014391 [Malus domestica]